MKTALTLAMVAALAVTALAATPKANPTQLPTPVVQAMSMVNVNTATVAQLETLPGIGPKTAAEIIKNRPYKNAADFRAKVKRIGNAEWAKIEKRVSFK